MARSATTSSLTVLGLELPDDIHTLDGFRRWLASLEDAPAPRPTGSFIAGKVYIDMSPQDYRSHHPVARAINRVLDRLCEEGDLGKYFTPPCWVTDDAGPISTEPDGFLVTWGSLRRRVKVNPQRRSELMGAPDMALEVVSASTPKKDLQDLVEAYAAGGVREYWTADARGERPELVVRVLQRRRYREQPVVDGWVTSPMFGRAFRLVRFKDKAGWTDFRLESRPA